MAQFLKIKFLTILKLNFNEGQFIKKYKNCKFCTSITFEKENVDYLR